MNIQLLVTVCRQDDNNTFLTSHWCFYHFTVLFQVGFFFFKSTILLPNTLLRTSPTSLCIKTRDRKVNLLIKLTNYSLIERTITAAQQLIFVPAST